MYRGWTQIDYQNKHYNINQKDEGTLDDRGRDGGTNFILRIKEQETRLILQEHDDENFTDNISNSPRHRSRYRSVSAVLISSSHSKQMRSLCIPVCADSG